MNMPNAQQAQNPSQKIDERIEELGDWRGDTLSRIRDLIKSKRSKLPFFLG
ncbi:hypothetical protein [Martelella sp. FOR1707]